MCCFDWISFVLRLSQLLPGMALTARPYSSPQKEMESHEAPKEDPKAGSQADVGGKTCPDAANA